MKKNHFFLGSYIYILYFSFIIINQNTMNKAEDYRIEEFNRGELFAVVDDYGMYGNYYKTRKGAEKQLKKVLHMVGATK